MHVQYTQSCIHDNKECKKKHLTRTKIPQIKQGKLHIELTIVRERSSGIKYFVSSSEGA